MGVDVGGACSGLEVRVDWGSTHPAALFCVAVVRHPKFIFEI